ncbi:phosphotransferase [Agromyces atrinae]|uniref:phosphotransferase n=1 Tax=Agromyces atrinae TaxID=592376 RepID=UPI001F5A3C98|nr:phosphotransferase [Agromyces atrinae]MCI2957485.1 phosphotransferase [Agromyces atrinae]
MLPLSEIARLRATVDTEWRSPVADAAGVTWNIAPGRARWWRSSASHVFVVPGSETEPRRFLRFVPTGTPQALALAHGARQLVEWADDGLGAARPLVSTGGTLTATMATPLGEMIAMLVDEAPGEEVDADELDEARARAWGAALARVHLSPSTGADRPVPRAAGILDDPVRDAVVALQAAVDELTRAEAPRGAVHGDFELDNVRFGSSGVTFFDADDSGSDLSAVDIAHALRDIDGGALGAGTSPSLVAAFLAGYDAVRPRTQTERGHERFFSLVASARFVCRLPDALDARGDDDSASWLRDLRGDLDAHLDWHSARIVSEAPAAIEALRATCRSAHRPGRTAGAGR